MGYKIGDLVLDENDNRGVVCIMWNDGDMCAIENDAAHPSPIKCSAKDAEEYFQYLEKSKIIRPSESILKRAIILIGLCALSFAMVVSAVYGVICFCKKVGWLSW